MTAPTDPPSPTAPALAPASTVPQYEGWWRVPEGLLTKAQLAELEFPRRPTEIPAGRVWSEDFRGRRNRLLVDLYRPGACPPTTASAAQLRAAAVRTNNRVYECAVCGCRPERAIDASDPLCRVCRRIQRLRTQQEEARRVQRKVAELVATAVTEPGAVILHATQNGDRTPAGQPRPPLSARICAVAAADGRKLLDVTVSLVTNPRARLHDPDAVPPAEVADKVIALLDAKTLICWDRSDLWTLALAVPHEWPNGDYSTHRPRSVTVDGWSTSWRAQMNTEGERIAASHPGTADRLWLHLTRIAATVESPAKR